MATTWIDIADSAVKIGLGAIIAGIVAVTTPLVAFAKEVHLDRRNRRLRLLEESMTQLESHFSFLGLRMASSCDAAQSRITKRGEVEMMTRYNDMMKKVDTSAADRSAATAKLELLGQHELAERIRALAAKIRIECAAFFEIKTYEEGEVRYKQLAEHFKAERLIILSQLGKIYSEEPELKKVAMFDIDSI